MELNINISDEQATLWEALRVKTGAANLKEVVDAALTTYQWAANEVESGCEIAAVDERNEAYKVYNFGPLKAVAAKVAPTPA